MKMFLDLLAVLEEGHHEVVGSASTPKGRRELKNLECSINFDARGIGVLVFLFLLWCSLYRLLMYLGAPHAFLIIFV